jgi:hypothetical protein
MAMRALLPALLALAGCEGTIEAGPDFSAGVPCTGRLSGAVTESIVGCRVTWDEQSGTAQIGNDGELSVSDPSQIVVGDTFGFVFTVDGDAHTGSFGSDNVQSFAAGVDLPGDGGTLHYLAFFTAAPNGPPNSGSLAVQLNDLTPDLMSGSERRWIVHGHLDATLVPGPFSPATGSVTMMLDF